MSLQTLAMFSRKQNCPLMRTTVQKGKEDEGSVRGQSPGNVIEGREKSSHIDLKCLLCAGHFTYVIIF